MAAYRTLRLQPTADCLPLKRSTAYLRTFAICLLLTTAQCCIAQRCSAQTPPPSSAAPLRVLSFNIWTDAKQGGVDATAAVIRAAEADLVGVQEVKEIGDQLAQQTGLTFVAQTKGGILTRYPVLSRSAAGLGIEVEIAAGQSLWFYNVHLHHEPYQPYQLAGIAYGKNNPFVHTAAAAIGEATRARGPEMAQLLLDLEPAILSGNPIVITGDFNEPSHLDWTQSVVDAGRIPLPVAWPTSRLMIDAGFQDAYRQIHPDPLSQPGHTWTPLPSPQDVMDRIDFVYFRNWVPQSARVVGESAEHADVVVTPYPSDHRAVLVEFSAGKR